MASFKPKTGPRARPTVSPNEVTELKQSVLEANRYRSLEESDTRNVLMVGRSRSGKSTAVRVLKDPTFEPSKMSLFPDTEFPTFIKTFALYTKEGEQLNSVIYTLNVIETSGLMEGTGTYGRPAKLDESIVMKSFQACLKNEVTKIHCLLIFVSFEVGITRDDIECFQKYYNSFYHESVPVVICIARAEDKDDVWKSHLIEELKQHSDFSKLMDRSNVSVAFMGCVDSNAIRNAHSIEDLNYLYGEVFEMREHILQTIFKSDHAVSLLDLPASKAPKEKAAKLLQDQLERLQRLEEMKDYNVQVAKTLMYEVIAVNNELKCMFMGVFMSLENDEIIPARIMQIKEYMTEIATRLSPEAKREFMGDIRE